jgi:hypothetical protein
MFGNITLTKLEEAISISRYGRTLEACPRRRCPLGEKPIEK